MTTTMLVGGQVIAAHWQWHSEPRRRLHKALVRLGLLVPPVHRESEYVYELVDETRAAIDDMWRHLNQMVVHEPIWSERNQRATIAQLMREAEPFLSGAS
jgi:hypothetical protein